MTESNQKTLLKNLTMSDVIKITNEIFPFAKGDNCIIETEYRLNVLDMMEILIQLLKYEMENEKC